MDHPTPNYVPQKGPRAHLFITLQQEEIDEDSTSCPLGIKVAYVATEMGFLISVMVRDPEVAEARENITARDTVGTITNANSFRVVTEMSDLWRSLVLAN